jgi:hypothetical protein
MAEIQCLIQVLTNPSVPCIFLQAPIVPQVMRLLFICPVISILNANIPGHATCADHSLVTTSLLDVALAWSLVLADEVFSRMLAQPVGHLQELFSETVDGLLIHVRLGYQLRECDYAVSDIAKNVVNKDVETHPRVDTDAQLHRYLLHPSQPILLLRYSRARVSPDTGCARIFVLKVSKTSVIHGDYFSPVEQDATQASLKVFFKTGHNFLQDICLRTTWSSLRLLES